MNRKEKAMEFAQEGYNISITGRNVLITDSMKDYAMEKISKIEKFNNRLIDVNVIMDIQKYEHRVEIILKVNNVVITSHASTKDMYASIDMAVDKIQRQLRKYKTRLQDYNNKNLASIDLNVSVLSQNADDDLAEINDEIESANNKALEEDYHPHKIIAKETKQLKTLTYDEAIMKLELSGQNFLHFRSEEENKLRCIYRKRDGNLAIIDLE